MLQVPQLDFSSFNFAGGLQIIQAERDYDGLVWTGPSQRLQHTAMAVMGLGQILPISPPAPNATWKLDFWGPALRCDNVAQPERDEIYTNIWNSLPQK